MGGAGAQGGFLSQAGHTFPRRFLCAPAPGLSKLRLEGGCLGHGLARHAHHAKAGARVLPHGLARVVAPHETRDAAPQAQVALATVLCLEAPPGVRQPWAGMLEAAPLGLVGLGGIVGVVGQQLELVELVELAELVGLGVAFVRENVAVVAFGEGPGEAVPSQAATVPLAERSPLRWFLHRWVRHQ